MKNKKNALVVGKKQDLQNVGQNDLQIENGQSPASIMQMALNKNLDLDRVEKMLELQEKWEKIEAKKAYVKAMAEFKKDAPKIYKDKKVGFDSKKSGVGPTNYNYASLGNITQSINSSLANHGLSAGFKLEQPEGRVKVTCTITHELGHSESTSLTAGADNTGNKNSIQAISSTTSYLEKYTILALTGLSTHEQDDDGNSAEPPQPAEEIDYLTSKHKQYVLDMIASADVEIPALLKLLPGEIDSIDNIPLDMYDTCIALLKLKKAAGTNGDNN